MARKRLVDTEELYFDSELIQILEAKGLHLYIRLWGIAEDWGGYEPKYADIALKMGALRFKPKEVENYICKLIEKKKIIEYEINGKKIHWLVKLLKHQPLDNPAPPRLPLPEWIGCEICQYKSGKKYAKYTIIDEKLPVVYRSVTSNGVTNSNVTNGNRIETEKKNQFVREFFDYFTLKTKKKFTLTPERKAIIEKRWKEGRTLEELKGAVDNFIQDDWADRHKYIDVVYCIGVRNKLDNLDRWLTYKPKDKGLIYK